MKIRAKPIDEVIKFTRVKHLEEEPISNTNTSEIEEILIILGNLYKTKQKNSVGIITPHTNQQRLLIEKINSLEFKDYLYDELNLKIMTFDTCQGEERDLIIYSMVADEETDHLWGVFIKDLNGIDLEEDGKIKAQRLNVGLSRAKECVHFIISKDVDLFSGAIGEALKHYWVVLNEAKKQKESNEVDEKSPMEAKLLDWFYQTKFYEELKDRIEILPQFELGKYLSQLDAEYSHPKYVVDFLLLVKDPQLHDKKIIIEYDGFQEHFTSIDEVNEYNYENYYNEDDVYRQKVLESYGYRFLRVNRFNLTHSPITTLSDRLFEVINGKINNSSVIDNIQETILKLRNGDKKECSKCHEFKDLQDFQDESLISGQGRICKQCKNLVETNIITESEFEGYICPVCRSKMVLRSGRYGKFLGCSKFPYCKGTRRI
jgi:very-short-patch-repair endonuclease